MTQIQIGQWVAWWLQHRTPDRKGWVRCPMPVNTLRVHMEYVLVKSEGQKVYCGMNGEYFPHLHSHCKIMEVEIGGVAIYRPFGEFRRAISYCHLYGAQGLGVLLAPYHDEFRGPHSDYVRQVTLATQIRKSKLF
ncbi:uncharacterized protein TNCV_1611811 [Trichonephila clavipes]|nr:uncharacterized protein TNCV_1611811 [Trichonephila clavipes]